MIYNPYYVTRFDRFQ